MYHADGTKIHPRRRSKRTFSPRNNATVHVNKEQLKQLQEAFNLIDQDRDGVISKDDLQSILVSLGQKPTERQLRDMLNEVPGNVDFARFVSMFASKMGAADPEDLIRNAFTCFDDDCDGVINLEEFKEMLMTMGLRLTEQQADLKFLRRGLNRNVRVATNNIWATRSLTSVDEVFLHGTLTDDDGRFKCEDIVKLLKYGEGNS